MIAVRWLLLGLVGAVTDHDVRIPPSIVGSPLLDNRSELYYETDDFLSLHCRSLGHPSPQITWYVSTYDQNTHKLQKSRVDLSSQFISQQPDGRLDFDGMYSITQGYYHCEASNAYGRALSPYVHLIHAVISRVPFETALVRTVNEGESVILQCQIPKCVPPPTVQWFLATGYSDRNPTYVRSDKRVTINPDGDLYISHVEQEDERGGKLYKCMINNNVLDITVGGSYQSLTVNPALASPLELVYPANDETVIAIFGEDIELKCIFSGNPAATISWAREGGTFPQGRKSLRNFDSELVISNAQWSDEGEYTCTGDNGVGMANHTFTVDVQSAPTFVKTIPGVLLDVNATEGQNVEFYCEADRHTEPEPEITFLINASPVSDEQTGSRKSITPIGSDRYGKILRINNVCRDCVLGETDLMAIQCRIENKHGSILKSVTLIVFV